MNSAEICRRNGWKVGDRLEGTEGDNSWSNTNVIEITAIGEDSILAKCVSHNGKPHPCREMNWTLELRDWTLVK